jgi:hypothetical protein
MKPTSALLIAIAAFVIDPWTSSLALAQTRAESPAGIQPQDRAQDNVLAYHGGADRSGNFTVPGLTWERARSLHLDQAFQARISGNVYAQLLFWRTPGSNIGRLLVATEGNNVYALDATTGHLIWTHSLGKPVPGRATPPNRNPSAATLRRPILNDVGLRTPSRHHEPKSFHLAVPDKRAIRIRRSAGGVHDAL